MRFLSKKVIILSLMFLASAGIVAGTLTPYLLSRAAVGDTSDDEIILYVPDRPGRPWEGIDDCEWGWNDGVNLPPANPIDSDSVTEISARHETGNVWQISFGQNFMDIFMQMLVRHNIHIARVQQTVGVYQFSRISAGNVFIPIGAESIGEKFCLGQYGVAYRIKLSQ